MTDDKNASEANKNNILAMMNVDGTPLYSNPAELEKVLFALTQPNNDDLKRATLLIHDFLLKSDCILPLIQQIENSKSEEVRNVAAVYLKNAIEEFYQEIPANIKPKLKEFLIKKLISSNNRGERIAIASAIVSVGKYALIVNKNNENWKDLLITLENISLNQTESNNNELREVSYIIWRNLMAFCGRSLKQHFLKILDILKYGLEENNNLNSLKIRVESLMAIGNLCEFLENENEINVIDKIMPNMISVINECLKKGDEENVIQGMEVFNNLIESKVPVLNKHALSLSNFNLKIASTSNLPLTVRKQATNFGTWLVKSKPKIVVKHNLVPQFLTLCINFVIESDDKDLFCHHLDSDDPNNSLLHDNNEDNKDNDKDNDNKYLTPMGIAIDLLDEIFLNIPSDHCFPISMNAIQSLIKDNNPHRRKAAYIILSLMCDGCSEYIYKEDTIELLLNIIINGINDNHISVRRCSYEALAQMSTYSMNSEVLQFHKKIIPLICNSFNNKNEDITVKTRSLHALEMFIDTNNENDDTDDYDPNNNNNNDNVPKTEFSLTEYLEPVMNVVGNCIDINNLDLQIQAIAVLNVCATGAGIHFLNYLPKTIALLDSLLQIKEPKQLELRSKATLCLGSVVTAVGYKNIQNVLPKLHEYVMQGIESDFHDLLAESTFIYFGDLANVLGGNLLQLDSFLDMLHYILFAMENEDGLHIDLGDDGLTGAISKKLTQNTEDVQRVTEEQLQEYMSQIPDENIIDDEEEAENDDNDEDDDEHDNNDLEDEKMYDEYLKSRLGDLTAYNLKVRTGFMEEKSAAVQALTFFIRNGGSDFLEYMEDCWDNLVVLWEYPHSLVTISVANCFYEFFSILVNEALSNNNQAIAIPHHSGEKSRASYAYPWKRNINIEYSENVKKWISEIFPKFIDSIINEGEKESLAVVLDLLIDALRILGPSSIAPYMDELLNNINMFLLEKCVCQTGGKGHASEVLDDNSIINKYKDDDIDGVKDIPVKHNNVNNIMADLIATLAELWGPNQFEKIFEKIVNNLLNFGRSTRDTADQAMMIGCVADVCCKLYERDHKTTVMSKFSDVLYQNALRIAQATDANMRQNALYCIGSLFQVCNQSSNLQHLQNVLRCIKAFAQLNEKSDRAQQLVRDNAISALGKILITETDSLPTSELLPIFIQNVPLTADVEENQYIYDIIRRFILNEPQIIQPYIVESLTILGKGLEDEVMPPKTIDNISNLFKQICNDKTIQQIVQTKLPPNVQQNIMKTLQN